MKDDGDVLVRARANLWRGAEAVGGRLVLTRNHLCFRAHALNIQTDPLDLPIGQIVSMRKYNNLKIIPNGLAVTMASGAVYHFVVRRSDRFIAAIEARRP
ncbi:GRAM domain-containing protein [Dactylosporangium sp. NPDC051484]|uniref:GRAM domain-containing protein n=1 Tax=Dactylosporangium sp. NPDC051484 TaxID=3154942 RepID=UPI003450C027